MVESMGRWERFSNQTKWPQKTTVKSEFCCTRCRIWKSANNNADPADFIFLIFNDWLSFPQHVDAGQRAVGVSSGLPLLSQSLLLMYSYSMYSRLAGLRAYRRLACFCLLSPQGNAGITHESHCIQLFIWFLELELSHQVFWPVFSFVKTPHPPL